MIKLSKLENLNLEGVLVLNNDPGVKLVLVLGVGVVVAVIGTNPNSNWGVLGLVLTGVLVVLGLPMLDEGLGVGLVMNLGPGRPPLGLTAKEGVLVLSPGCL